MRNNMTYDSATAVRDIDHVVPVQLLEYFHDIIKRIKVSDLWAKISWIEMTFVTCQIRHTVTEVKFDKFMFRAYRMVAEILCYSDDPQKVGWVGM